MSFRKVTLNTVALTCVQGANLLIPVFILPYLANLFGPAMLGELVYIQSIMALGIMLVEFGFGWSLTKAISINKNSRSIISKLFSTGIIAQLALAILFAVICALLSAVFVERELIKCYVYAYLTVISSAFMPMWLFQGMEKLVVAAAIQLVGKSLLLPLLYLYADEGGLRGLEQSLICFSISSIVTSFLILVYIKFSGFVSFKMPSVKDVYKLLRNSFHLFISRILISLYTLLLPLVLGLVGGAAQLAYFTLAEKVKIGMQALLSPLSQALFPRVNILYKENPAEALIILRRVIFYSSLIAILATVMVNVYTRELVMFLGGSEFTPSIDVLRGLSIAPIFIVISSVLGVQILVARGFNQVFLKILGVGSIFSLVFVYPVVINYGAIGVAWLVVSVELLIALLMIGFVYSARLHVHR